MCLVCPGLAGRPARMLLGVVWKPTRSGLRSAISTAKFSSCFRLLVGCWRLLVAGKVMVPVSLVSVSSGVRTADPFYLWHRHVMSLSVALSLCPQSLRLSVPALPQVVAVGVESGMLLGETCAAAAVAAEEALLWWRRAAAEGHAGAYHRLGEAYTTGDGGGAPSRLVQRPDQTVAVAYFRAAADLGEEPASTALILLPSAVDPCLSSPLPRHVCAFCVCLSCPAPLANCARPGLPPPGHSPRPNAKVLTSKDVRGCEDVRVRGLTCKPRFGRPHRGPNQGRRRVRQGRGRAAELDCRAALPPPRRRRRCAAFPAWQRVAWQRVADFGGRIGRQRQKLAVVAGAGCPEAQCWLASARLDPPPVPPPPPPPQEQGGQRPRDEHPSRAAARLWAAAAEAGTIG